MKSLKTLRKPAAATALALGLVFGGGSAAQALTSYVEGGYATSSGSYRTITAKDTSADGNRIYGNYWKTGNSKRFQVITYNYGETASATMAKGIQVHHFQACVDKPISGDTCGPIKYNPYV
ncbi:hypothetical protein [Brachybacterium alimentarium]|uniref:hypothetical protein n=1 Tax=Brachybacterium alimentarium TaxID=47845 RepID=UPI0011C05A5D|nr:hypothetical protein [Brachybacterium alimentarium]